MTESPPVSGEHSAEEHLDLLADRCDCLGGQVAYPGALYVLETIAVGRNVAQREVLSRAVASLVLVGEVLNQGFRN